MKKLELNQMENLEGEKGGFMTGLSCGLTIIAGAAIITTTFGGGTVIAGMAAGVVCGGSIGWGSASGDWW
jgi:hypothetical protein